MRKHFDRDLYNENDAKAKAAAKEILKNFKVEDNPKKTGVDLLVYNKQGEHIFNVECEIKKVWVDKFTYTDVQFPERKSKYCLLEKPTFFIMFNKDLSQYLVVSSKNLLNSPLEIVPNKYISYGEKFFKVPLNKVLFNEFRV